MGARYYNPRLGRWIQPDTIVPDAGNPQALNRYSYVYNNPTQYIDPDGHEPISFFLLLAALGGLVLFSGSMLTSDVTLPNNAPRHSDITFGVIGLGMMLPFFGKEILEAAGGACVLNPDGCRQVVDSAVKTKEAGAAACTTVDCADIAKSLTQVDPNSLNSPAANDLVRTITDASTHNGNSDYTLLGTFPEYTDLAQTEGMRYFNMPSATWDILAKTDPAYVRAINMQFLEDGIANGSRFVVTMGEGKVEGQWLQEEIQYLLNHGYHLVDGVYVP